MSQTLNKILDLIENVRLNELSTDTIQSYRAKRLKEPLDKRTPQKTKGIHKSFQKLSRRDHANDKGTFGDNMGYDQGRYMGDSVEDDVEESMVARVQSGRKMVSAEAALRHAREIAHKRNPGSKPTISDIATAHRNLTSGVNHESVDELSTDLLGRYKKAATSDSSAADKVGNTEKANKRFSGVMKATKKQFANSTKSVTESFAVKDSSGKTVDVKFSDIDAKKRAEELSKKTGAKHTVVYERTAMVKTVKENTDGKDTVTLEIPAIIRALEWARETAKDDNEIHKFVERLINHEGKVDMEFFDVNNEDIVPSADRKIDNVNESKKFTWASLDALPDHPIERHASPYEGAAVGEYTEMFMGLSSAQRFAKFVEYSGGKVRLGKRGRDIYVYHKGAGPLSYRDMMKTVSD